MTIQQTGRQQERNVFGSVLFRHVWSFLPCLVNVVVLGVAHAPSRSREASFCEPSECRVARHPSSHKNAGPITSGTCRTREMTSVFFLSFWLGLPETVSFVVQLFDRRLSCHRAEAVGLRIRWSGAGCHECPTPVLQLLRIDIIADMVGATLMGSRSRMRAGHSSLGFFPAP